VQAQTQGEIMSYELRNLPTLKKSTEELDKILNNKLGRFEMPEYAKLRKKVRALRAYYTDREGADNLRFDQINFIVNIMTKLPLPGKDSDSRARLILLGALFHRLERLEYSYDVNQLPAFKSWTMFFAKQVITLETSNSRLYHAIGHDILDLQLGEKNKEYSIDSLTMYDSCNALSKFLTAKIKSSSESSAKEVEVYTKLKYICDEKGQDPKTGKKVFDKGLKRIINLHKEDIARMKAVHYFTAFVKSFVEKIETICVDVNSVLETLERPINEALEQGTEITQSNFKELFKGKGVTDADLEKLVRFIPEGNTYNSINQANEFRKDVVGWSEANQRYLISGLYFFVLDEVKQRANTNGSAVSRTSYEALVSTLKEVLGIELIPEDDKQLLEKKKTSLAILHQFVKGNKNELNLELAHFPSKLKHFKEEAIDLPLLNNFKCFGTIDDILKEILGLHNSTKAKLEEIKSQASESIFAAI